MYKHSLSIFLQGALTHGDRRAGESRDLSRFNIDNKYGRAALETVFKAIMGYEAPIVQPPSDYKGDFFKGIVSNIACFLTSNKTFMWILHIYNTKPFYFLHRYCRWLSGRGPNHSKRGHAWDATTRQRSQ